MEKDQILLENVREYVQEANEALEKKHYNSAVTLYFKALAVLTDWYILKKRGIVWSIIGISFITLFGMFFFGTEVAGKMVSLKPAMIEVDISCPHVDYGKPICSDKELTMEITRAVKKNTKIPDNKVNRANLFMT